MITIIIVLVVVLILGSAVWYANDMLTPEPIQKFIRVIIVVAAAIVLAYLILGLHPDTLKLR